MLGGVSTMNRSTILRFLMKLAGKGDMELGASIPTSYIASTCVTYGVALLCGAIRRHGISVAEGKCFIRRGVTLRCKSMIQLGSSVRLLDGVYIDALSRDGVKLGDKCLLGRNTRIECAGTLSSIGKGIRIDANSTFGAECYFGAAGGGLKSVPM